LGCLKIPYGDEAEILTWPKNRERESEEKNIFFRRRCIEKKEVPQKKCTSYYPFGLTFNSYKKPGVINQNFKYNGKEEINDLGVNWQDYGARMYDAALGRWSVVDPLADLMSDVSIYTYAHNNPLRYIDPDGAIPWDQILKNFALTSTFGWRIHPIKKTKKYHDGIDMGTIVGSSVSAVADGKVIISKWNSGKSDPNEQVGYGRYIVIDHGEGYYSLYGHLKGDGVKIIKGQNVVEGEVIGLSGNTGGSTNPHLHFEIRQGTSFWKATKIDPRSIKDLQKLLNALLKDGEDDDVTILEEVFVTAKREGNGKLEPKSIPSTLNNKGRKPGDWGYQGSVYSARDAVKNWNPYVNPDD